MPMSMVELQKSLRGLRLSGMSATLEARARRDAWAVLVAGLRAIGRKVPINDSWIAATAIARGIPVATQDDDYDQMPGLDVIRL